MTRMESGGDHAGVVVRADTRFKGDLGERVEAYLENHGLDATELVREAVEDYLPDEEVDGPYIRPPNTPELQDALDTLQECARSDNGRVDADAALSELAQHTGQKKETVRKTRVQPLIEQGYVKELRGGWDARGDTVYRVILPTDIPSIIGDDTDTAVAGGSDD
ncbi:hypothetical protein [Halocalculus aciditolerans]|uniref:Uncharacterized protein n=1 Tax=Halocalculus aciditolerans TaxID=1383812 RepID=A0A830F324_9EURY|nr:hypothetical protein [Halocalculus aciditolerans]GGL57821.1 hypothetical protein GCM10009039_14990 [Halocalculus aciditolerans]